MCLNTERRLSLTEEPPIPHSHLAANTVCLAPLQSLYDQLQSTISPCPRCVSTLLNSFGNHHFTLLTAPLNHQASRLTVTAAVIEGEICLLCLSVEDCFCFPNVRSLRTAAVYSCICLFPLICQRRPVRMVEGHPVNS